MRSLSITAHDFREFERNSQSWLMTKANDFCEDTGLCLADFHVEAAVEFLRSIGPRMDECERNRIARIKAGRTIEQQAAWLGTTVEAVKESETV
jgi:hypothetical protein